MPSVSSITYTSEMFTLEQPAKQELEFKDVWASRWAPDRAVYEARIAAEEAEEKRAKDGAGLKVRNVQAEVVEPAAKGVMENGADDKASKHVAGMQARINELEEMVRSLSALDQ